MSITPDSARSSRFCLHVLGTLLLPHAPQRGVKHRKRNMPLSLHPSQRSSATPGVQQRANGRTLVIQIELWMKSRQKRDWLRGPPSRLVLLRMSSPVMCRRSQCSTQARRETGRRTCRPTGTLPYRKHIDRRLGHRHRRSSFCHFSFGYSLHPSGRSILALGMGRVSIWFIAPFSGPRSWLIGVIQGSCRSN
jgi:hypothetical protein